MTQQHTNENDINYKLQFIDNGTDEVLGLPSFELSPFTENLSCRWEFDVTGAPDDFKKLIINAYSNGLNDYWSNHEELDNSNGRQSFIVKPNLGGENPGKLKKLNDDEIINVIIRLVGSDKKIIAEAKSEQIKIPKIYTQTVYFQIKTDPGKWKILNRMEDIDQSLTSLIVPIDFTIQEKPRAFDDTSKIMNPHLTFNFDAVEVTALSKKWDVDSLPEQLQKLKRQVESSEMECETKDNGLRKWTFQINNFFFKFDPIETDKLLKHYMIGNRFIIPITLQCEGAVPCRLQIEILPQYKICAEQIAIDLGSSVSTACFGSPDFGNIVHEYGFPEEQLQYIQPRLLEWFQSRPPEECPVTDEVWADFILNIASRMEFDVDDRNEERALKRLKQVLIDRKTDQFYKFLLAMELSLRSMSDCGDIKCRSWCRKRLFDIYQETFLQFPFDNRHIKLARLEDDNQMVSEFCFNSEDRPFWPDGKIGKKVAEERKLHETKGESTARYHRNPKKEIYDIYNVDNRAKEIYQGALDSFVSTARSEFAKIEQNQRDSVPYLILTYPVTLMPKSRHRLVQLARQMGYPRANIIDKYDESVAPAIFYLDKYFGNFDEIGPEVFKMKCIRENDMWTHNMLIVDIGAGTTDISLIQIEMKEAYPNNDRELGGRSYQITPTLLGSLGFSQVGGNLLTLCIYHYLKIILARFLWQFYNQDSTSNPFSNDINITLADIRFSANTNFEILRNEAEKIISTYTKDDDGEFMTNVADYQERILCFDYLWQWAENIKICFSRRKSDHPNDIFKGLDLYEGDRSYGLQGIKDEIASNPTFLKCFFHSENKNDATICEYVQKQRQLLFFSEKVFRDLEEEVIKNVVERAVELTTTALGVRQEGLQRKRKITGRIESCQGVHSIILSGRSSRLPQVRQMFETEVSKACKSRSENNSIPLFACPQTQIIFEDKYAKTATVTGALRAEMIDRSSYYDVDDNVRLLSGCCYRDLNVKNLLFNLPSAFCSENDTIFKLQSEFEVFDFHGNERIRSGDFKTPQKGIVISRRIGNMDIHKQYANIELKHFEELLKNLDGISMERLRIQYEINPELQIHLLIARIPEGKNELDLYYDTNCLYKTLSCDIAKSELKELFGEGTVQNTAIYASNNILINTEEYKEDDTTKDVYPILKYPIYVTTTPDATPESAILLFDKDKTVLNKKCISSSSPNPIPCVWSDEFLELIKTKGRILNFFIEKEGKRGIPQRIRLGGINLNPNEHKDYRLWEHRLKVLLTKDGRLILFVGKQPPYWETTDIKEWSKNDSMVLYKDITGGNSSNQTELDPFNGRQ